jgi:3-oxoacyl-[acyl-carrier-protein] synthase-3
MNGRDVFKIAARVMARTARKMLEQPGLTVDLIARALPHQANRRIIETLARDPAISLHRSVINLNRYGNASADSLPLALDEAGRAGRIGPGEVSPLLAFGAGLTYGSALIRW